MNLAVHLDYVYICTYIMLPLFFFLHQQSASIFFAAPPNAKSTVRSNAEEPFAAADVAAQRLVGTNFELQTWMHRDLGKITATCRLQRLILPSW